MTDSTHSGAISDHSDVTQDTTGRIHHDVNEARCPAPTSTHPPCRVAPVVDSPENARLRRVARGLVRIALPPKDGINDGRGRAQSHDKDAREPATSVRTRPVVGSSDITLECICCVGEFAAVQQ
jgi:hypothetical protein